MNTSNRKKLVAASENQGLLAPEKEALLKVLVRQVANCAPSKLLQITDQMINEVIFESDVDGVHYYIVRCRHSAVIADATASHLVNGENMRCSHQNSRHTNSNPKNFPENINLSPREQAIAKLVARGLPNKSIGIHLKISPWTVATHLRRIFVKLGVSSRTAMITRLLEENLLHD
jgi:two-component system, NarL family, nitrate/nitrite response regulator NarL